MNDRPRRSSTRPAMPAPPPPSTNPRSHRPDLIQTAPDLPVPRARPSPAPGFGHPEHPGQRDPGRTDPELGQRVAEERSRREIKTVPGGGLNRISDGRAAAAAYVGVKTLPEMPKQAPPTISKVKLGRELLVDNKEFRTEPALRGQSFPPPAPSRATPITPRRALSLRRGSPQAVMALVAMLAVAVGVLFVVAADGRWLPHTALGTDAASEVEWDHGIDGQSGVLSPPVGVSDPASNHARPGDDTQSAQVDEAAGQPADGGPAARSAAPTPTNDSSNPSAAGPTTARTVARAPASSESTISGNGIAERSKVDPKAESGLDAHSAPESAPPPRSIRPSTASASQPERAPPQPWLE